MRRFASAGAAVAALALGTAGAAVPPAPAPPSGAELAALAAAPVRSPLASERIYFVLPDRYANGDPANDRGGLDGPRGVTGYDPADTGFFHGGDLKGLVGGCEDERTGLARLRRLGFTALWVTPPVRQKAVQGPTAGYHGYWGLDLTTVDPHLGTEQDFADLVSCAHRLGLKIFLDVVVNHTADVIIPTGGTSYVSPEDRPYRDCRGRAFAAARYSGARTFPCVRAADMPRVPVVLPADRTAKRPAWLNDPRRYHNRGDIQWDSCNEACYELGDFYGLDDLFTEQPAVVNGLARVYGDWVRKYALDGFRIDTARHVDRRFFTRFLPQVRAAAREAGVRDFEVFGEVFLDSAIDLAEQMKRRSLPTVLDFPLQSALLGYVSGRASARGIAARLDDDDYFLRGDGRAFAPPTFLGNHDVGRVGGLVADRSGARGDELTRRVLLAHSLLYLLRGAPVVYYGDELGLAGSGGDRNARQDLFPTQVRHWQTEPRVGAPPIGAGSSFDVEGHPVGEHLRMLGALRDAEPALATGASVVRLAQREVFAVSRVDAAARRELLVAFNAGETAASVTLPTATPDAGWVDLLGRHAPVSSGPDGRVAVTLPPLAAVVLRPGVQIPELVPAAPVLRVAPDELTESVAVRASVAGPPVSVAFAVKRSGRPWTRLATDDSPPYRAFLDPRTYRRGERVHVVAVARSLAGATALSRVTAVTPRRG